MNPLASQQAFLDSIFELFAQGAPDFAVPRDAECSPKTERPQPREVFCNDYGSVDSVAVGPGAPQTHSTVAPGSLHVHLAEVLAPSPPVPARGEAPIDEPPQAWSMPQAIRPLAYDAPDEPRQSAWQVNVLQASVPRPLYWPHRPSSGFTAGDTMVWTGCATLPLPMQFIWQGDDGGALYDVLVSHRSAIFEVSHTLGIDSTMLAHRLQRRTCARMLLMDGLWRPVLTAHEMHAQVPQVLHTKVQQVYEKYLQAHRATVLRLADFAQELADAALNGELVDMEATHEALRHHLAEDKTLLPLLPNEFWHVDLWIHGAVLGALLHGFDQECLFARPRHCLLLAQAAARLSYPLEREHLYLAAP